MRKSLKALSLVLGVTLLLAALGVGAVLAADPTPTPTAPSTPAGYQQLFLSKVAEILGIDEQKLTDAIAQAQKETRNQMIDDAVKEGRITQEYADWLKQMPTQDGFKFGFGMWGGRRGGWMHGGLGWPGKVAPAPAPTQ